jgi:serine/threonine protein phosphatase 1
LKYYVTSDIHSFYSLFIEALQKAGYFEDEGEKKIIICGDLFDRGDESKELQQYVLNLLLKDQVILIKGNHEGLFEEFCTVDDGQAYDHHRRNGTYKTALSLTGLMLPLALSQPDLLADECKRTPYYTTIIPAMLDFYETEHYVFTHGWIPCFKKGNFRYSYCGDWRNATHQSWAAARWMNGMDYANAGVTEKGKTIVCGHRNTSYGHSKFEHKGSEFGENADFTPFVAAGIIALDACTAHSGMVNVKVIEDNPLHENE